jgi:hypothetical protein
MGQGVRDQLNYFFEYFRKRIVEHQKDFANDQLEDTMTEPKDFVEAFLKEMRRKELANEKGHHFRSIIYRNKTTSGRPSCGSAL